MFEADSRKIKKGFVFPFEVALLKLQIFLTSFHQSSVRHLGEFQDFYMGESVTYC